MKIPKRFFDAFKSLALSTRREKQSESELAASIAEYWSTLHELPSDALYDAVGHLRIRCRFMPTAAEWHEAALAILRTRTRERQAGSRRPDCDRCGSTGYLLLETRPEGPTYQEVRTCEAAGGHFFEGNGPACTNCGATRKQLHTRAFQVMTGGRSGRLEAARLLGVDPKKLDGHNARARAKAAAEEPWPFPPAVTYVQWCSCRTGRATPYLHGLDDAPSATPPTEASSEG